jgi:hypothetical protein
MSEGITKLFEMAESLVDQKHLLPAIEALEEARRLTQIPDRRALASYNLGTIHWHSLGDGLSARREFLATIETFERNGYGQHPRLKVIHANACENMMLCALSFDEFEDFAKRLDALAPKEPILTGLVPDVRANRERGDAWSELLFDFAARNYNRNDPKRDVGRYGQARSTYHLILTHRRDLRLSREDWRMAIYEFCALSMRMVSDCIKARGGDNDPDSPEEFLPILTEAIPLMDEYLDAFPGDEDHRKIRQNMEEIVTGCCERWEAWNQGERFASPDSFRPYPARLFSSEAPPQFPPAKPGAGKAPIMLHIFIVFLLLLPLLFGLGAAPPVFFNTFLLVALIPFIAALSRAVTDPVSGINRPTKLSPGQFHQWANFVCSGREYQEMYMQYMLDENRSPGSKLPAMPSQLQAIAYVHAWKILLLFLIPLNAFELFDLFRGNLAYQIPIPMGGFTGMFWGYSIGLYILWRTCQHAQAKGAIPK